MSKNREKIWIPEIHSEQREPIVKKQEIVLSLPVGTLAGFVKVELIEAATGIVKECHEFPNIILTAGFDGLFFNQGANNSLLSSMLDRVTIGTGSTTVSPSDLKLDEEVERTSSTAKRKFYRSNFKSI